MEQRINELYKLTKTFCRNWNIKDEDILQDLVWKVYQSLDKYDNTKSEFSTFVYMNCKNFYLQSKRHFKEIQSLDSQIDEGLCLLDVVNDGTYNEKSSYVKYIYNNVISPLLKDYLNGLKQKDLVDKYKLPYPTLNKHIHKELKKLKETYGE